MGLAKAKKSNLKPKNLNELKTVVQAGCNSISLETCQKYSKSFSKWALNVLKVKGVHTKYWIKIWVFLRHF